MNDCYLALDVGGSRIKSALIDTHGRLIRRLVHATQAERGAGHVLDKMEEMGRVLLNELHQEHELRAVAIAFTGVVDPATGVVVMLNGKIPDIEGVAVGPLLSERFQVPVRVDNDGRAYTLGEWKYGAGRGYENLVCVTVGTGIGTGVIKDGQILRSAGLLGGILGGHFTIDPGGPLCACGNRGCLELFASAPALVSYVREHLQRGCTSLLARDLDGTLGPLDSRLVFEAVTKGDELARFAFERWVRYLGAGLVTLIHAYDPDIVILGGGVLHSGDTILPFLESYVAKHAWTWPKGRVKIRPAQLGDDAALLGGVALMEEEI